MKKYFEKENIKVALEESEKMNITTYVVMYTEGAEAVYKVENKGPMFYLIPVETEETLMVIETSIEDIEAELTKNYPNGYVVVNAFGIMGLSQFLFENKGGFLDIFENDMQTTPSQSWAMIGAAAANLNKPVKIGDITVLPDRIHSFTYKLKIEDELGVRHTYTLDISKF